MLVNLSEIIPSTNILEFLVFYLIFFNKVRLGEKAKIFGDIYKYKKSIFSNNSKSWWNDGKKPENIVEI